jgi:hypothetical protein
MSNLVLHCGGKAVTRQQVEAIPVPPATKTHFPVAYKTAIELLHETIIEHTGLAIRQEAYGLNENGDQLFALTTLETGNAEHGLSIGLRQSYNKSLALGVAVGAQVFVCDNLCFRGDAFMVVRKNTKFVLDDFKSMLVHQVKASLIHYNNMQADIGLMKAKPCELRRGFELLGAAYGEGLLTTTQATVAFEDWRKPRHEEFADRNLWGLYNATTEALKKGGVGTAISRHTEMHDFVLKAAA